MEILSNYRTINLIYLIFSYKIKFKLEWFHKNGHKFGKAQKILIIGWKDFAQKLLTWKNGKKNWNKVVFCNKKFV